MDKALKLSIVFAVIVIALSLAYYLVIYLPQKEQAQLDLQKQAQIQKQIQDQAAKNAADQRASSLRVCLLLADTNGADFWNSECKAQGLGDNCRLPQYNADRVDKSINDAKSVCFKEYPQ